MSTSRASTDCALRALGRIDAAQLKAKLMRTFLFSAIAASAVVATTVFGLSTDANAAKRKASPPQQPAPLIHHHHRDPYGVHGSFGPGVDTFHGRRDVHPVSGTPRWNAAGGAA